MNQHDRWFVTPNQNFESGITFMVMPLPSAICIIKMDLGITKNIHHLFSNDEGIISSTP